jgi:hypothetical protein
MDPLLLGESINTYDPALALRGQTGSFLVNFGDETLVITCKPGHSISNVTWADHKDRRPFTVTKITEPVTMTENTVPLRKTG